MNAHTFSGRPATTSGQSTWRLIPPSFHKTRPPHEQQLWYLQLSLGFLQDQQPFDACSAAAGEAIAVALRPFDPPLPPTRLRPRDAMCLDRTWQSHHPPRYAAKVYHPCAPMLGDLDPEEILLAAAGATQQLLSMHPSPCLRLPPSPCSHPLHSGHNAPTHDHSPWSP